MSTDQIITVGDDFTVKVLPLLKLYLPNDYTEFVHFVKDDVSSTSYLKRLANVKVFVKTGRMFNNK